MKTSKISENISRIRFKSRFINPFIQLDSYISSLTSTIYVMKTLYIIFSIVASSMLWVSCSDDDDKTIAEAIEAPQIITPNSVVVLNEEQESNPAFTLVWNHSNFGAPTQVNYTVEMDLAGNEFSESVVVAQTSDRFFTWTVSELNQALINKGAKADEQVSVEFRVLSSIGVEEVGQTISNISILTATPYSTEVVTTGPGIFMVGNFQKYYEKSEWTPTEAIRMTLIGAEEDQQYEAFVKLNTDDGFKFITAMADWAELEGNYGTIGGAQDGNLENSGGSSDIKATEPGLYYVKVDIPNLTYQLVKMDWGIIGSATPEGWDAETAMEYDFDTNSFSIDSALVEGELKFRSQNTGEAIFPGEDNNAWKFNVGTGDDSRAVDQGDGNFMPAAGNASITLQIDFEGNTTVEGL